MATFLKDDQNVLVRDQNRYRKIYRYIRKKPRPLNCEGSDISNFVWGSYFVEFKHQTEVEHNFPCCYESAPAVIATTVAKGTAAAGTAAKVSYMTFGERVPTTATATATAAGGAITGVTVTNAGSGYSGSPTITVSGGGGSGAVLSAIMDAGSVSSVNIIGGGTGFTSTPTLSFAAPPAMDSSDTVVGQDSPPNLANLEREFIDLKNVDDTIYRIRFTDASGGDNFSHANKPAYTPSEELTINVADVGHYGLGNSFTNGTDSSVTFQFKHPIGSPTKHFHSDYALSGNVYGSETLQSLLQNMWWDFRNNPLDSNSIWRIKITGGAHNYPSDHSTSVSRVPTKTFSIAPTGSTLGEWMTSFKNLLATTDVGGSKFTDRWEITTTNGTAGSAGMTLKFETKLGNKGTLSNLTGGGVTGSPFFYDSYARARSAGEDDVIFHQIAATTGDGTETSKTGLVTKIVNAVNGDPTFSSKWSAAASSNSVERVDGVGLAAKYYETFIITFTAASGNLGVISNITDAGGTDPGTFYYGYNHLLATRGTTVSPGAQIFRLHTSSQYRNERYNNLDQNPPDPLPILSANGAAGGGAGGQPVVPSNPNFNVFVTDISMEKCTFRTSGYFTGYVYYQALVDGAYTMPNIGKSLEVKTLQFDGINDYVTHPFTATFTCEPIVTVTADNDVNAFVTALSKTSVTVEVSKAGYKGKVYLQAIEKGC